MFRGQFRFHIFLSQSRLYKTGLGAHFRHRISNTGLCFSAEGAATAFRLQGRDILFIVHFDHTENFMTTRLNVISVSFV